MAAKEAGNTGVRNELVAIIDALYKKKEITSEEYKKLNLDITS
jgi:hypothetical protein